MKKILFILVLAFFVCGFIDQVNLDPNVKQCIDDFTGKNYGLARESCRKVVEKEKKGILADAADAMVTITELSDEEDLLKNLDKFKNFSVVYITMGDYFYDKNDYSNALVYYRKANENQYDCNKVKELPFEKKIVAEIKQLCENYVLRSQGRFGQILVDSEDEKEVKEGLVLLEKAYKKGDNTLFNLCEKSYYDKDYEKVAKFCTPLSDKGNEKATLMLAYMEYLRIDNEKVNKLLKPLIKKDNKDAKCILGLTIIDDEDEKLRQKGIKLLDESVGQKNDAYPVWVLEGKSSLADIYYRGKGVNVDYKKALELATEIEKETSPNTPSDIYMVLGFMHFMGLGTEINNTLAYDYWQKAYQDENPGAGPLIEYEDLQEYFRFMCGIKLSKNIDEYREWLDKNHKKYLIKKDLDPQEYYISLSWYGKFAKQGYNFANWYLALDNLRVGLDIEAVDYLSKVDF